MRRFIHRTGAAALCLALGATVHTAAAQPPASHALYWIVNGHTFDTLVRDSTARALLDSPRAFVSRRLGVPSRGRWRYTRTVTFPSYAAMSAAFQAGRVGPDVGAVLYDDEA